jgi:hypothetical protein
VLEDEELYKNLKDFRKRAGELFAIRTDHFRNVEKDVGAGLPERTAIEPVGVLKRNVNRLKEALRTVEELFKTLGEESDLVKELRFEVYGYEKEIWRKMGRLFLKESRVVNFYPVSEVHSALREADFHTAVVLLGEGWEEFVVKILRLAHRCFVALDDLRGAEFLGLYGLWGDEKNFLGFRGEFADGEWTSWECGEERFQIRIGKRV